MIKVSRLLAGAALILLSACTKLFEVETPSGDKFQMSMELTTEDGKEHHLIFGDKKYVYEEKTALGSDHNKNATLAVYTIDRDKEVQIKCIEFRHSEPDVTDFEMCTKLGVVSSTFALLPAGSILTPIDEPASEADQTGQPATADGAAQPQKNRPPATALPETGRAPAKAGGDRAGIPCPPPSGPAAPTGEGFVGTRDLILINGDVYGV